MSDSIILTKAAIPVDNGDKAAYKSKKNIP